MRGRHAVTSTGLDVTRDPLSGYTANYQESRLCMLGKTTAPFTLDEYYEGLNARLAADTTLVFVDTNILAYPYRLFSAARRELLEWFGELRGQNRLRVPAWAANEYFVRTSTENLRDFFPKLEPRASLDHLDGQLQMARLALDDAALRAPANRDDLIRDLEAAIAALRPQLEALTVDQRQASAVHDEVEAAFGECVLSTDIAHLCCTTSLTAQYRMIHRLPPGFEDAQKKANSFGDLILWNELLEFMQGVDPRPQHAILLTNDEKRDWSYWPRMRRRVNRAGVLGIEQNERPRVNITDPRLVQEFRARIGNQAADFEVASIRHVIASLARAAPGRFRILSVALQLEIAQDAERGAGDGAAMDDEDRADGGNLAQAEHEPSASAMGSIDEPGRASPTVTGVEMTPIAEAVNQSSQVAPLAAMSSVSAEALADSQYRAETKSTEIDKAIEDLRSHNWYVQNPAVIRIASFARRAYSADAWFVLGRNVYQAACGNARSAVEYLRRLRSHLDAMPEGTANAMLGGMLYEVYFDSAGELRAGKYKVAYLDALAVVAGIERYVPAVRFVNQRLIDSHAAIASLPSELRHSSVFVQAEPIDGDDGRIAYWEIRDWLVDGESVIKDGKSRGFIGTSEVNLQELLGQTYGLPPSFLDFTFEPAESKGMFIDLPDGKAIKTGAEMFAAPGVRHADRHDDPHSGEEI